MLALLTTKRHPPRLPPRYVKRPHLVRRLSAGFASGHRVFLVSAPAGFGKTMCLTEWLDEISAPFAWLSLELADDDPGRFFIYLIAALQDIDPRIGAELAGILRAGQLPPQEIIAAALVNDIQQLDTRFLLVLDDFQVIQDPIILEGIEKLIVNAPEALVLVLLTREDPALPLARLRAKNQLTEIRAADLRFSAAETKQFLAEVMGIPLSEPDLQALEKKTEGWVAGLHLVGLSVRDRSDSSAMIARLGGSQRFIFSYLTEEVLNQQPKEIHQFLLKTSILDKLCAGLCDAVTGSTGSAEMLARLTAENLFLISLDEEGHWYRYHHLFGDLLRDMQAARPSAELSELHRRACDWYARNQMIDEAIHHALASSNYEMVVHLIEIHAMDLLMQWHVKTVEGWTQAVHPEWIAHSPRANLVFAWLYLVRGKPGLAQPYLERLGPMFSMPQGPTADPGLHARWLVLQAMLLNAQGKPNDSLELSRRALEIVPTEDALTLSQIFLSMSTAYQQLDDYAHALDAFRQISRHCRESGDSVSEIVGVVGMALFAIHRGDLHFAFELVSEGIKRMEHSGVIPPISTALYGELGEIYYQWHQLDRAHSCFQRAIKVSVLSGYPDAEIYYGVINSRLAQIAGDLESAAAEIQKTVNLMQTVPASVVDEEVIAQQIRVLLARDQLAAAEAVLKHRGFAFGKHSQFPQLSSHVDRPLAVLQISALRILLHRAISLAETENLPQGIAIASQLLESMLNQGYTHLSLELLLLRARLFALLDNKDASQQDYLHALRLGEPENFISVFIEGGPPVARALSALQAQAGRAAISLPYLESILQAFSTVEPPSRPPLVETSLVVERLIDPLSARELEILRLIGAGLSNQEITKRLFITLHTVKKHTSNIYTKLGVKSRTQAVARARHLGLL